MQILAHVSIIIIIIGIFFLIFTDSQFPLYIYFFLFFLFWYIFFLNRDKEVLLLLTFKTSNQFINVYTDDLMFIKNIYYFHIKKKKSIYLFIYYLYTCRSVWLNGQERKNNFVTYI